MPSNIPLRILCVNCDQFPTECVESNCCSSIFCSHCSADLLECPSCNIAFECRPNVPLQRLINEMEVRCRIEECGKVVTVGNRDEHESICPYRFVECPWSADCGKVRRKELEEHLMDCPHREIPCPYMCDNMIEFSSMGYHLEVCDELIVDCPNHCGETCARKDRYKHLEICPNAVVPCEYSQYGCPYNVMRGEIEQHGQDFMCKHLRLVCLRMRDQQDEIDLLRRDLDFQKSFYKRSWKLHEVVQLIALLVLAFSAFPNLFFLFPTFIAIFFIALSTHRSIYADTLLEFIAWQSIGWISQAMIYGPRFFITVASTGLFVIAGRMALSNGN